MEERKEIKNKKKIMLLALLLLLFITILSFSIYFLNKDDETNYYTVTFEINGGSLISGNLNQQIKEGENANAPSLTKTGYTLSWNLSFDNVTSNLTVKAVWTKKDYSISLVYNNGMPNAIKTVTYDEEYNFDVPMKNDYYFDGFYEEDNGVGKRYTNFESIGCEKWQTDEEITLYAYWLKGTDGIVYILEGDAYTVSDFTLSADKTFVIAGAIDNNPVTKIGANAFYGKLETVEELFIPCGIKIIENEAFFSFSGMLVRKLILPNTLKHIGNSAFDRSYHLEYLVVPASVEYMGTEVFGGAENIVAIFYCDIPTETSPFSMYGSPLFYVKSILVPAQYLDNYLAADDWYFARYVYSLDDVIIHENYVTKDDQLIACFNMHAGEMDILNDVKTISEFAFGLGNPDIFEDLIINLPEGLEEISRYSFYRAKNIKQITIPASVCYVAENTFYSWTEEQTIYVTRSSIASWDENWYNNCDAKILDEFGEEIIF